MLEENKLIKPNISELNDEANKEDVEIINSQNLNMEIENSEKDIINNCINLCKSNTYKINNLNIEINKSKTFNKSDTKILKNSHNLNNNTIIIKQKNKEKLKETKEENKKIEDYTSNKMNIETLQQEKNADEENKVLNKNCTINPEKIIINSSDSY